MPTENESYHELFIKYYNIVVDILRAYNCITEDKVLTADFNFVEEVGEIFKANGLVD